MNVSVETGTIVILFEQMFGEQLYYVYIKQHLLEQMDKQEELEFMKEQFIEKQIESWDRTLLEEFAFDSMFKYYEDYTEKQFKDMVIDRYGMKELMQLMQRIKVKKKRWMRVPG